MTTDAAVVEQTLPDYPDPERLNRMAAIAVLYGGRAVWPDRTVRSLGQRELFVVATPNGERDDQSLALYRRESGAEVGGFFWLWRSHWGPYTRGEFARSSRVVPDSAVEQTLQAMCLNT